MDYDLRQKSRALLIQSKLYRFFSLVFAFAGLGLFAFIYFKLSDGNLIKAFSDPFMIAIMLVPFIPSMILNQMAHKMEGKLKKIIDKAGFEPQESYILKDFDFDE